MIAPRSVPVRRSRAETFDELVLEAVVALQHRLPDQLRTVEFVVEDVPVDAPQDGVQLGSSHPAQPGRPARVVVYRRPVESRVSGERMRAALVHDVVVEQVAELLGVQPETVDPDYGLD